MDSESGNYLQVVIPRDGTGIDWGEVESGDTFIVNGREYSGFGAGKIADHKFDPDGEPLERLVPENDNPDAVDLSVATAARPNRIGEPFDELIADDGYLSSDRSPNEPWDAPDQHNMFLSGMIGEDNDVIPSFHRDRLYDYQYRRTKSAIDVVSSTMIRRFSFRPMYLSDNGSTASRARRPGVRSSTPESWFGRYLENGARDPAVRLNSEDGLDVDTNMDGKNDSVWIDIGLPNQTDANGIRYRPLVAYRIIDLDGRLNLNAHGMKEQASDVTPVRTGTGYGVAEISLNEVLENYDDLLRDRYGDDDEPGSKNNALTPDYLPTQKMPGHPRINTKTSQRFATAADFFASNVFTALDGDSEAMPEYHPLKPVLAQNPYLADFSLGGGVGDSHFRAHELEGVLREGDIDAQLIRGRLNHSGIDADRFTTHSFEIAIPATSRSVLELLRDRLSLEFDGEDQKEVFNIFTSDRHQNKEGDRSFEMKYISKDMLMGGRFNLIPILGNGVDNDLDGVIDDSDELNLGRESFRIPDISETQFGDPVYDLNNDPSTDDSHVKSLMAKQLYLLALLTCGDTAPENYPGDGTTSDELYRQSVAQWAVNIVDFYDTDSIMTVFEYDVNPFNDPRVFKNLVDGDPRTDEETERGIVYGAERPEILITETFAHHDRQNEPAPEKANNDNPDEGDIEWISRRVPQSSLYVELYHPHRQSTVQEDRRQGYQSLPFELSNLRPPEDFVESLSSKVTGIDLGILAPDHTPVWRIAVHRGPSATEKDEHVRTIYFTDPVGSKAPDPEHDCFFPSIEPRTLQPNNGGYLVLGTEGNVGNGEQTFGRLTTIAADKDPTALEISKTRAIRITDQAVVIRDWDGNRIREVVKRSCIGTVVSRFRSGHTGAISSRGLSLSDPDGGYPVRKANIDRTLDADGVTLKEPRGTPFDADAAANNRDSKDMEAIWTNGIKQDSDYQFRVLKLQRLADPESGFHEFANPYVTVDLANVDLFSFNGMRENPTNEVVPDHNDSLGTKYELTFHKATLGGIERGEQVAKDRSPEVARRQLFRALGRIVFSEQNIDPLKSVDRNDDHNLSFKFTEGDASEANDIMRHETLGGRNGSYDDTNQYSWMMWNNRPYANKMELANVPMLSAEGIVRHFNRSGEETDKIAGAEADADTAFSQFFGNNQFGHLPGSGAVVRNGISRPNRFDWLWEYVEVPNRFLGSETWLPTRDESGNPFFIAANGPLKFNLHPPMHSIPNFRYPGKINLNTIYHEEIWCALTRGFGCLDFETFRSDRETEIGASDFGRHYTTAQGAEFTDNKNGLRKGAEANLFRTGDDHGELLTDGINDDTYEKGTDVDASAVFKNEFRTRLGIAATTRSNVYAVWVTIGYFEVDEYGRVGPEIGVEEGDVERNRAFYIFDRSIPVACEPGENHNVDNAVLTRTIIE